MCEVTESESVERRLESLAAENDVLRVENAQLNMIWRDVNRERCGLRAEVERLKLALADRVDRHDRDGKALLRLGAEHERLKAERDRMRAACEAAREFLSDAVAYGLARQEKGRVLGLIRAALDGDDLPAGEEGVHGPR
jgi:chromosome segregation ATPase